MLTKLASTKMENGGFVAFCVYVCLCGLLLFFTLKRVKLIQFYVCRR